MQERLQQFKAEMEQELKNILQYWMHHTLDEANGGFIGRIDHNEVRHHEAPKGVVLNSRILWSFSAAYKLTKKHEYKVVAERAFDYLLQHFIDNEYGGVFWTVDYKGGPLDTKKQIYALSFALYGLSEYSRATGDPKAKEEAVRLYGVITDHSYDNVYGGYVEALARDWTAVADIRLSAKDANEPKSMNTHLHVLEGFTNLYRIWPDNGLKEKLIELIRLFLHYIIDSKNHHLILFFDDAWNRKSNNISYGHDIEAAWLLQEAAEVVGDATMLKEVKERSVLIAEAAAEGLDADGSLWYEYEPDEAHLITQKHWWPQAEAMVGFFNTWQLTGEEKWLEYSLHNWNFIKEHILDKEGGEWVWGVHEDYSLMTGEDKVGIWKCPYHNSRACMEFMQRISTYQELTVRFNNNKISHH